MPHPVLVVVSVLVFASALVSACAPQAGPGGGRDPAPASTARVFAEPDAGAAAVLSLIASARSALWMEMYLLTDADTIAALVERRRAGCDVRVILEPHPYLDDGANDAAFSALAAAGVTARWASPRFALTHAKFATIDHARLVVLTLNLTRSGLAGNREYVALDDDPTDVAAADEVIAADLSGAQAALPAASRRMVASPLGTRPAISALLAGATGSLALEMEELSDAATVDSLLDAVARGVAVGIGLPATGRSGATDSAARRLSAAGATTRLVGAPPIHAKAIVADGNRLYLGSANLTTASLDANREVGLVLMDDPAAIVLVADTIAADLSVGAPGP